MGDIKIQVGYRKNTLDLTEAEQMQVAFRNEWINMQKIQYMCWYNCRLAIIKIITKSCEIWEGLVCSVLMEVRQYRYWWV